MLNAILALTLTFSSIVVGIEDSLDFVEDNGIEEEVYMTPNLKVVYDYVKITYGLSMGVTNCRRISGSQTYSQHSWSNAVDIYTSSKDLQDRIAGELGRVFGEDIRNILTWRYNAAHWNHLHVDMWPKGWLTPPCEGADLRIKFKDGSVTVNEPFPLTIIKEDDMAILTDSEQIELRKFLARIREANSNVGFVTQSIADIRERNVRGMPAKEAHGHDDDGALAEAEKALALANEALDKLEGMKEALA